MISTVPATINQLHVVGGQIGVEAYSEPENKNPVEIAQNAIKHAKANSFNVVSSIPLVVWLWMKK